MVYTKAFVLAIALTLFSAFGSHAVFAEEESSYQAVTANSAISEDELEQKLIPLTREELAGEAEAWMGLVKEKNQQFVDAKLAASTVDESQQAAFQEKVATLDNDAKTASSLFDLVLDAWEKKGGDADTITKYQQYISTVHTESVKTAKSADLVKMAKDWMLSREGGGRLLTQAVVLIMALLVLLFIAKFVARAVTRATSRVPGMSNLLQDFLVKFARIGTIVVGLLLVLAAFGIDMGPLFALIGGASFIIAFAMQSTLSNFAAGLMVMIYHPFDVGDVVTLAGVTGKVASMNLVSTTIVTADNQQIIIPNSNAWGSIITNVNRNDTRRVDMIFGIGYEDDMAKAQQVMEEVVNNHPLVLKDPAPTVKVHELADSSVNYVCRPWVMTSDYWNVYWDITRQVKERFDAEGISIPYPQTDVHLITKSSGETA